MDPDLLRVAGRLHDVGMAAVSDAVLLKPGPLTREERREVEEHAELGLPRCSPARASSCWNRGRDRAGPTTSAGTARATRAGWRARRSRSRGGSWRSPTRSTRSPPSASTARRGTIEEAVATLADERGKQLDPRVVDALPRRARRGARDPRRASRCPRASRRAAPEDAQMTLQAAAATLSISPSRLRRWADEGRITAIRTAGGHRRFPLEAVRRLAAERGVRPQVPPGRAAHDRRCPLLAQQLRAHGRQMAAAAAAAGLPRRPAGLVRHRRRRDRPRRLARRARRRAARAASTPARCGPPRR